MNIKLILILIGAIFLFFLCTAWAVFNVAQKDFGSTGKKAFWWVIASIPFVGFLIYLVFGFRKGKKMTS
jgi:uncharacterized membrane protein YhaH (DUF805 family)